MKRDARLPVFGRTRETLWIGVVGHRPAALRPESGGNGIAPEVDLALLHARVRAVLARLGTLDEHVAVISSLAEGADRVVAREALAAGYPLYGLLPFPRDDYAGDFQADASLREYQELLDQAEDVHELSGSYESSEGRNDAYAAAAESLLLLVDVLIAIWDGQPARGVGGTGDSVLKAVERDIPVIWINSQTPHDVTLLVGDDTAPREAPMDELPIRLARRHHHRAPF